MAERKVPKRRRGGRKTHRETGFSKDPVYNRGSSLYPTERLWDSTIGRGRLVEETSGTPRRDAAQELILDPSRPRPGAATSSLPPGLGAAIDDASAAFWDAPIASLEKHRVTAMRNAGITVMTNERGLQVAVHPLSMRRVPAKALFDDLYRISLATPGAASPSLDMDRAISDAAEALRTGEGPGGKKAEPFRAREARTDVDIETRRARHSEMLRGPDRPSAKLSRAGLRSEMYGIEKGVREADELAAERLVARGIKGAGRKVAAAAGGALAGPLLELGAREDPSVRGELRATEELVTQIPGLAQRGSLPVTGVEPERIDAALAVRRAQAQGFPESQYRAPAWWQAKQAAGMRPAPDIGPPQEGLAEAARQALYALGIGSPGAQIEQAEVDWLLAEDERRRAAASTKVSRPQHAAPRTRTMK